MGAARVLAMARGFVALVVACSIAAAAAAPAKPNGIFTEMSPDGILVETRQHPSELPKFLQAKVPAPKVALGNTAHEAFTKNPFITVAGETIEMQIEAAVGGGGQGGPPEALKPPQGPPEGDAPELPECHAECISKDESGATCNVESCKGCNDACDGSHDFLMQMGDHSCHDACFDGDDCAGCGELGCHAACADDSDGPEEMPECHKDCIMQDEEPEKCDPEGCGHYHYDGYGGGSGSGMFLPECGPCIQKFDDNGGCEIWASGDDPMTAVPDECMNHMHCAEEALMHCTDQLPCGMCVADFADAGGCKVWMEGGDPTDLVPPMCYHCGDAAAMHCFNSEGQHGPEGAEEKDCGQCASEFSQNGGCQVWKAGLDVKEYIPDGCDDSCAEEAEIECGMEQHAVVKAIVKEMKQQMTLAGISPDDITDDALQAYAVAMAIELGLYDEETKAIKPGSSVECRVVSNEERAATLLQADATVPETDLLTVGDDSATLEFTTQTDNVAVSGDSVTASGFADAVNTANSDQGTSAPAVDASSITVEAASESTSSTEETKTEESGASSTVPTLLAGCLVVATALFTKA